MADDHAFSFSAEQRAAFLQALQQMSGCSDEAMRPYQRMSNRELWELNFDLKTWMEVKRKTA